MALKDLMQKEVHLLDIVDRAATAPLKYTGAVAMGIALVIVESPIMQGARKVIRPDMENPDLGNSFQRFMLGYNNTIDAFNYRPK